MNHAQRLGNIEMVGHVTANGKDKYDPEISPHTSLLYKRIGNKLYLSVRVHIVKNIPHREKH